MAVDPASTATTVAVEVAQYGFLAAVIGALVTFGLGLLTNRREKEKVADESVEEVLNQRILLRDEIIAHRDKTIERKNKVIARLKQEKADLQAEHDRCRLAMEETRAEERAHLDEQH